MTDYASEQAMEVEALQAILAEDFEEIDATAAPDGLLSGPGAVGPAYMLTVAPKDTDEEEPTEIPG